MRKVEVFTIRKTNDTISGRVWVPERRSKREGMKLLFLIKVVTVGVLPQRYLQLPLLPLLKLIHRA